MAGTYNLKIDQGATLRLHFGAPDFDLTGYESRMYLAPGYKQTYDLALTEGAGLTTSSDGVLVEISDLQTAELASGGVWMLEVFNGESTWRLVEGSWVVNPEV